MKYLVNALSINMVDIEVRDNRFQFDCDPISEEEFEEIKLDYESYIGHPDVAKILGVKYNREPVVFGLGDEGLLAQYFGKRLPEGATRLPDGVIIKFYKVKLIQKRGK